LELKARIKEKEAQMAFFLDSFDSNENVFQENKEIKD
jgi:hypothetical protein